MRGLLQVLEGKQVRSSGQTKGKAVMKWGCGIEGGARGGGGVGPPFEKEPDTAPRRFQDRRFPKRAYMQMETIYVYNMNTYIHINIHVHIYMCA